MQSNSEKHKGPPLSSIRIILDGGHLLADAAQLFELLKVWCGAVYWNQSIKHWESIRRGLSKIARNKSGQIVIPEIH